jgi:hypothetical protein
MDGATAGLIGGIAGGVVGILGGLLGTYVGIRNTHGPRERAFAIRASIFCWIAVSTFLAALILLPMPWRFLMWLPFGPVLMFFTRWANRGQALAVAEDSGGPPIIRTTNP